MTAHSRLRVALPTLFLLLMLWGLCGLELQRAEQEEIYDARIRTTFQAQAFAENTRSTIKRINELLFDLRSDWRGDARAFAELVRARQQHISDITFQVGVIGPDGLAAFSNLSPVLDRLDLSQREHFRVHRTGGGDHLFISRPVLGKLSGKWSIQFTRPIYRQEQFAGVMVISVAPETFSRFRESLNLGRRGATTLVRDSGELMARSPQLPDALGKILPLAADIHAQPGLSGNFERISPLDQQARVFGYYRLPEYQLSFIVGEAREDVLEPYFRYRHKLLMMTAGLSLALVAMAFWLFRLLAARELVRCQLQESQEQQQRLSLALSQSRQAVVMATLDGQVIYANEACLAPRQLALADVLGRDFGQFYSALLPFAEYQTLRRSVASGQRWEKEIVAEQGQWTALKVVPLSDEQGRISHFVAMAEDITPRKEQELELRQAKEAAEAANQAKSQFLANMSHEIRTPLNGILGFVHLAQRDGEATPRMQERLHQIAGAGQHLLGIINDILDFSKVEAGKLDLDMTAVDLPALLNDALALIGPQAADKGLTLDLDAAPLPHRAMTDPLRLRQILGNLLSNAVKFTHRGQIRLTGTVHDDHLVFQVSDTGIGMDATQIARIFKPFEQADGSTTRRFGGTGLGLSITQHLVALMGGTINVESSPGAGSCFTLHLPYLPAEPALPITDEIPPAAPKGERLAGIRVLVVEDNEINALIMEENLSLEAAVVSLAENGRIAVERVREAGPDGFDVVLMDIQMPEMNGHEATRHLRQMAPNLPVIGQTAHAFPEEQAACFESGMVDLVTKPIDPESLVALIRRHLR